MYRAMQCCKLRLYINRIRDIVRLLLTIRRVCWPHTELKIVHNALSFASCIIKISRLFCGHCERLIFRKTLNVKVNKLLGEEEVVFEKYMNQKMMVLV